MPPRRLRQPVKASAEIILIPKHLRMDWMDVMVLDIDLAPAYLKVAGAIGTHFGNKSGMTYVSQVKIAKVTGLNVRTVNRAIIDLEQRGYILIQRREIGTRLDGRKVYGGRGVANVYLPAVDAKQISATDRGQKLVAMAQKTWDEIQNGTSSKHDTDDVLSGAKQVMGVVLNVGESTTNTSAKHDTDDVPTLTDTSYQNSSRGRGPSSTDVLGPASAAVRKRFGDAVFVSWFSKVRLASETAGVVTLIAPTRFIRSHIEAQYSADLLRVWQSVSPTVERVVIVVEEASQAKKPVTSVVR